MITQVIFSLCLSMLSCYLILYLLAGQHNQRIDITQLTKPAQIFYTTYKPKKPPPPTPSKKQPPPKKQPLKKTPPKKPLTTSLKQPAMSTKLEQTPKNQSLVKNITDINQAAQIIRPVIPKYPDIAKKAGIEATVMLEIIVDEQGNVAHCHVLHCSHPGYKFEINAIDAAKKLKFKPFLQQSSPIKVKLIYPIHFILME